MVTSISSSGQTGTILQQNSRLETEYAAKTEQTSSGLKSTTFDGIAADSQKLLSLQSQYNRITSQTANATAVQSKVNEISDTLGSISTLLTSAMSDISLAISSTGSTSTDSTQATLQTVLSQLAGLLNTQYGGSYLFSGSAASTAPVDLSAASYDPTADPTTADTSYYQGNSQIARVQPSDSLTVSYGITADNPAFEQALRGLAVAIANPSDSSSLQQAYTLLQQASGGVTTLTAQTASQSSLLSNQIDINTQTLNYLDTNMNDLRSVDIAQVSTQLSEIENQLDASFSALAKLLNLNLSSYLK